MNDVCFVFINFSILLTVSHHFNKKYTSDKLIYWFLIDNFSYYSFGRKIECHVLKIFCKSQRQRKTVSR